MRKFLWFLAGLNMGVTIAGFAFNGPSVYLTVFFISGIGCAIAAAIGPREAPDA